jgi:hypothetical protein
MMNFAQEVSSATARGTAATKTEVITEKKEETVAEGLELKDGDVHPEFAPKKEEKKEEERKEDPKKKAKIKIGSQTFETEEEAFAYAEEQERLLLQKEAFEQGRESVSTKEEKPKDPDFFEEVENSFYENPKEALRKVYQKAIQDAEKKIETKRVEEESRRKTWEKFYSDNQDLVERKEVVDFILQKNWQEIGELPETKALKILADRTRSFLGSTKETTLPTKELQPGPAVTTGSSGSSTATSQAKSPTPLDFISQLNKHRNRTK